jgi:hypothetical protein
MANANVENESAAAGATPPLSFADVLEEFGAAWQIESAHFCMVAVRRPTPTSQEIVVGQTLDMLVEKLRAES